MRKTSSLLFGTVTLGLTLLALGCGKNSGGDAAPGASAVAAPSAEAPVVSKASRPPTLGNTRVLPPLLNILPGVGMAAIRFGATIATVERHIGAKCDVVTETRCAFIDRALEFQFEGGALTKIRVERRDRLVPGVSGGPRYYGLFNGGMAPKLQIGLHRHIVAEEFGEKPLRVEPLAGPDGQLEKEFYPGVALEYDRLSNGNVVLSGFEITKDATLAPKKTP